MLCFDVKVGQTTPQCDVPWVSLSLVVLVTLDFGRRTILSWDLLMYYQLPNSTPSLYALNASGSPDSNQEWSYFLTLQKVLQKGIPYWFRPA